MKSKKCDRNQPSDLFLRMGRDSSNFSQYSIPENLLSWECQIAYEVNCSTTEYRQEYVDSITQCLQRCWDDEICKQVQYNINGSMCRYYYQVGTSGSGVEGKSCTKKCNPRIKRLQRKFLLVTSISRICGYDIKSIFQKKSYWRVVFYPVKYKQNGILVWGI